MVKVIVYNSLSLIWISYFCKSGILTFIFADNNYNIYAPPCWLKHLCSIRALVPVSCFLSLSPSFSFSGWSPGAQRLSEFTFLSGLLRPSREGALQLHPIERGPKAFVNRASPAQGLYWLCQPLSLSFTFSLLDSGTPGSGPLKDLNDFWCLQEHNTKRGNNL